jgi:hypothetical protein
MRFSGSSAQCRAVAWLRAGDRSGAWFEKRVFKEPEYDAVTMHLKVIEGKDDG